MNTPARKVWVENHSGQSYDVYGYYIPTKIGNRIKFLKKYFKVLEKFNSIPYDYKRRKSYKEFAETAIMILARVEQFLSIDRPLIAGSRYLSPVPWSIFGKHEDLFAKNNFQDFKAICNFYEKRIFNHNPHSNNSEKETFCFRHEPNLCNKLAAKYDETSFYIMTVALSFLYDIILNCGPDCIEFYDVFTNDYREDADSIDIDRWQELRCKVLGRDGKIKSQAFDLTVGQVKQPSIPLVTVATIEEISDNDDLAQGEKTSPAKRPEIKTSLVRVGDKVRICNIKPNDNRWIPRMNETLGKIGVVKSMVNIDFGPTHVEREYSIEFDCISHKDVHWYPSDWFVVVKEVSSSNCELPLNYEPGDEIDHMYEFSPEVQRKMQKYNNLLPVSRCGFGPPNMM